MLRPMQDLPYQPILWGGEPHDFTKQSLTGDHQLQLGVYTAETTQRYVCGTRSMTWDGRVFRYARCGVANIVANKYGVKNCTVLVANKVTGTSTNEVVMQNAEVGDTSIKVTFSANTLGDFESTNYAEKTGVLAKDELCGGYISLYTGVYRQNRLILGNTAVVTDGLSMTLYLDGPLDHVITFGTSYCEILANPYGNVGWISDDRTSVVGIPNVTTTSGNYLWLLTWGIMRVSGHALDISETHRQRNYMFDSNGIVIPAAYDGAYTHNYQHAGFIVEHTPAETGDNYQAAPFIMIQISP